ncbi:hypothetical protein [Anaerosporobacter sp.]|uniref:hypothetical protein n=1 Tax=Anaerosporobacter sp. TaxID=1872529 RepID=UPI00286ECF38|nr:hypothetical protein [Anaerosporobacter sp.]
MEWTQFLSAMPANDYIFSKSPYEEQINRAADMLQEAENVLIGAGAGLSTAAGLIYGGKRFADNFGEFIEKIKFHFPQETAARIAVETVKEFLQTDTQIEKVIFNVFKQEDYDIYTKILG